MPLDSTFASEEESWIPEIRTRLAVELIPRQVCVVAAVDEIIGNWMAEIDWPRRV